jgi:RNA polymerase sigma-70 factor, ECF subfamily
MSVNQEDFGRNYQQYRERLVNSMTTVVRDREAAEDITATAYARALENLPRFRGECSLYTWVYKIALTKRGTARGATAPCRWTRSRGLNREH